MSWNVVVLPEVYSDLGAAVGWYESKQEGLGARFINEVLDLWTELEINPLLNSKRHPSRNVRWRYPKRFPYKVIYIVDENTESVVVAAVLHAARHEKALMKRIQGK